jgi:serine/threonine-protein kinase
VGEQVVPGTEVTVTVSQGRAPIDVPSVIGQPVDLARAQLEQLGLVATVEQVEDTAPAGQVVGQDPEAGAGAEPGQTVTLRVSNGPPTIAVPNVMGQPCDQARATLEGAGFQVRITGSQGPAIIQVPSAGTGLPAGSEVAIVCLG